MRLRPYVILAMSLVLAVAGCSTVVIDTSIPAVQAGDYTLATSACEATPGGGMDICRVREGTKIESDWLLITPFGKDSVLGGEVDVYYRDLHKNYTIQDKVVRIPWKDFFGSDTWAKDMDGEALALVLIRYKTPQGVEEVAKFRGIAKLVVTAEGYDRMPIDSGYAAWKTTCQIQYSSSGRGAIQCR